MKKLLGFLLLLLFGLACSPTLNMSSKKLQTKFCGELASANYNTYLNSIIDYQKKYPIKKNKEVVFPVKFHYSGTDRSFYNAIQKVLPQVIENLNLAFDDAHIKFKNKAKLDFISDAISLDELYQNQEKEYKFATLHEEQGFLHIFIMENSQNVVGFTQYPHKSVNRIFIAKDKILDASLVHEMGHYFGLLHTFEKSLNAAELAHQDHCELEGDKICDTPPDPLGASFIEDECQLYGNYFDENGNKFSPDMSNYMSYYGNCRNSFSSTQKKRMYWVAKKLKYPSLKKKPVFKTPLVEDKEPFLEFL